MTEIAVLGTGRMGGAIARRLLATGHRVTAWNRTGDRAAATGAAVADSPAAAAARADVVITMLTDGPAVAEVLTAAAVPPETVVVQMSTIAPRETRAIAAGIPLFVDAPVAGSVDAVAAGTLTIFAAGAVERAGGVLQNLGEVRNVGEAGAGSAVKLMQNTAMLTALAGLRESLALAGALGIDRDLAAGLLAAGPLATAYRRAASTTADFPVALAVKDLRLTGFDGPVVSATLAALEAVPDQHADLAALVGPVR
ncbi:2-hydroxy-3-oxopropionate reductase [Actinoplanes sp. SE50]|uniref:NAD(P)-dependent oxidoreductase n=1 Tax=unclassified Actinoplanes TaxID=2626549 RepID=UPI00023ED23F|nr:MULTISPECIES: NAD(P)-binding domain-containing protein [unclassified Actinoplanes]AEV84937.1 2-hydroxy-3-oxopropionate reductase [Actinoplanes sp. SE50/110]ATO83328.1 2-hydroxy-3-oxopropionate reductase [Actinoplanes sp. SE50]SLM00735.1 2-hydroxy-3-oxopropionate reductase [Actinoplanes sp. SE50/110]